MDRLWAPWRMTYITGAADDRGAGCFLCAMGEGGQGDPDLLTVARTELTFTVVNRFPYTSGHLMVVPRAHVADVLALDTKAGTALFIELQRALRALKAVMAPHGFNIGINHGFPAGGSVEDHVHVHIVPRWAGDTNYMPVLADVKVLPEALTETADRLRTAYASGAAEA